MPGIFINYRRQDALTEARAIYERLRAEFGSASVFIDLEGLDYGEDFAISLEKQLARCRVLLALIGPDWVDIRDARGNRRLDDTDDFVRIELRTALARGVRVVPVLLNGALLPLEQDLPDDLKPLRRRQKLDLDFNRFDADMGRLVGSLRKLQAALDASPATAPVPSPAPGQSVTPPRASPLDSGRHRLPATTDQALAPDAVGTATPDPKPAPASVRTPAAVPAPPGRRAVTPTVAPAQSGVQAVDRKPAPQPMSPPQRFVDPADASKAGAPAAVPLAPPTVSSPPNVPVQPTESVVDPSSAPLPPNRNPLIGVALVAVAFIVLIFASVLTSSTPPARLAEPEPVAATPAAVPAAETANPMTTQLEVPPLARFRDCEYADCPWLIRIPAGSFQMGSPSSEEGRAGGEGPLHPVTISQSFALGETEVTRGQFKRFVDATSYGMEGSCDWRNPGFTQTDEHPVVCVTWNDAQAYVRWLSQRTGQIYRLPSETEWEYAVRAGSGARYGWGDDPNHDKQCRFANGADQAAVRKYPGLTVAGCDDGFVNTAPVSSFAPTGFGLRDMYGNAWEWTEDCWNDRYNGAQTSEKAWERGDCAYRVLRGGSWRDDPQTLRAAFRFRYTTHERYDIIGFRVARTAP